MPRFRENFIICPFTRVKIEYAINLIQIVIMIDGLNIL